MNPKILMVAGVLLALVLVLGLYFPRMGVQTVVEKVVPGDQNLGSVTGPDSYFTYTANNDVKAYRTTAPINEASSTAACTFVTPPATTTIATNGLSADFDAATSTTGVFAHYFPGGAQAVGAYATGTTGLLGVLDNNGLLFSPVLVGTSTPTNLGLDRIVAPNSIIKVGFKGETSLNVANWGNCQLELKGVR